MKEKKHKSEKQNITQLWRRDEDSAGLKNKGLIAAYMIKAVFIVYAGVLPMIAFTTSLGFGFSAFAGVVRASIVILILIALKAIKKKLLRRIIFIIVAAVYTGVSISSVISGFGKVYNRIMYYIDMDMIDAARHDIVSDGDIKKLFFYMQMILIVVIFYSTWECVNMGVHILFTIPFYAVSYVIGITPSGNIAVGMFLYYVCLISMFRADMQAIMGRNISGYKINTTKKVTVQTGLITAVIFLAAIAVSISVESEDDYKNNGMYPEMRIKLENFFNTLDIGKLFKSNKKALSGMSNGELGNYDGIEMTDEEVLLFVMSQNPIVGNVYLRGYVAGEYESDVVDGRVQNSWQAAAPEMVRISKKNRSLFYNAMIQSYNLIEKAQNSGKKISESMAGLSETKCIINVFNPKEHNYAYVPYNSLNGQVSYTPRDGSMIIGSSPYHAGQISDDFNIYYVNPGVRFGLYEEWAAEGSRLRLLPMSNADTAQYREFVKERYTSVPEELTRFHEEFGGKRFAGLDECVKYIREYLGVNCTYSLSPGKHESGDFVENFLFDKKKGYCTYFASAAVLMLREFGYSARYAEGYVARCDGSEIILVTGKDAHAWAEVYIDGYGWVPVETTPGYNTDRGYVKPPEATTAPEATTEPEATTGEMTTKPEQTTAGNEDITTAPERTTDDEEADTSYTEGRGIGDRDNDGASSGVLDEIPAGIKIFILAAVLTGLAAYIISERRNKKMARLNAMLAGDDRKERIMALEKILDDIIRLEKLVISESDSREIQSGIIAEANREFTCEDIYELLRLTDMMRYTQKDYFSPDSMDETTAASIDESINACAGMVKKMAVNLYETKNIFVKCFIKYIKCLYLN